MEIKWLLEEGVFDENLDKMCKIIKEQGMDYKIIKPLDKLNDLYDMYNNNVQIVFYGSLNLMNSIIRSNGGFMNSNLAFNIKNFECTTYYPYFSKYLLNDRYIMLSATEAIRQQGFLARIFETTGTLNNSVFVRPNSGLKEFTGKVLKYQEKWDIEKDFECGFYYDNPNILILISNKKKINKEWRLVISDKKVITGSQYKINGELEVSKDCPQEVIDYGNKIAKNEWQPSKMYTMDICENEIQVNLYVCKKELKLLEINSFNCAGLYDCDLEAVIKEASRLASWENKDPNEPSFYMGKSQINIPTNKYK